MRTFIVGTEFSPRSDRALRRAVLLARQSGASLILTHTMSDDPENTFDVEQKAVELRTVLGETAGTVSRHDRVPCEYTLMTGSPYRALAETARDRAAELIVLGPHRSNQLKDIFLGTTAEKVLKETPCPVLIANGMPAANYSSILIATDFSDCSIIAARAVSALGMLDDVRVIVLHGFEKRDVGSVQRELIGQLENTQTVEQDEAAKSMRNYVRASGITPSKTVIVPLATATAETIRRVAEREQADLIVIGTNGRSGIEKFVLGSVAQDIAGNSAIDVLVVANAVI
ncbi:universal stress protein [Altererythrobacter sp. KTW20L]|uniref:universal stress protein n=1 Tax=Altererythrobacter sp. KTW20L TaxID=2942210 RepID=UPI0020C16EF9|nr:universal stress protein [Altererythrobacter sp. KTW20L]MCL6251389.1 universal stress protein [Altererythrobacter sp. KTW20L]